MWNNKKKAFTLSYDELSRDKANLEAFFGTKVTGMAYPYGTHDEKVRAVVLCLGHSYEFDFDNNWDMIEEFFKYISDRDDIFYGTNYEVLSPLF